MGAVGSDDRDDDGGCAISLVFVLSRCISRVYAGTQHQLVQDGCNVVRLSSISINKPFLLWNQPGG